MTHPPAIALLLLIGSSAAAWADGPSDNLPDKVRRIPPPGIMIPDEARAGLRAECDRLGRDIEGLNSSLASKPELLRLLPDVLVLHKAVDWALRHDEFYNPREIDAAKGLLRLGTERAEALAEGRAPWLAETGLVVRGYRSKIDGSVQPYGLVVPDSFKPHTRHRYRVDFWCHGRGETLTELAFLDQRRKNPGEFTPPETIVLHLYGRYCNANKLAGEVDLFEAYDHLQSNYPIDPDRLVVRGFSMGGAACWQFAVHNPGFFCAAAPGAGFSETPEFLRVFQKEELHPPGWEQILWRWYDCPGVAINLANLPTVAYSGENDRQKQAADIMADALGREGMSLTHLIGPKTEHKYHPETKLELDRRIDAIANRGRDPLPDRVRFATFTLRYDRSHWVRINALGRHWERAFIDAQIVGPGEVRISTENVASFTLEMPPGSCPLDPVGAPKVTINGTPVAATPVGTDRSWTFTHGEIPAGGKRHGLQGPIDDAFLDRFIFVRPTGESPNAAVQAWAKSEMEHAIEHWRRQFRGDVIVKDDAEIGPEEIASANLVLWGDPSSNRLLAKIADKLPIGWDAKALRVGEESYDPAHHVPAMAFPNPLNPDRYVVLNSGFTFREFDYLNNARQTAKLPDWAILDISAPITSRGPGRVAAAGFFGEHWELGAPQPRP